MNSNNLIVLYVIFSIAHFTYECVTILANSLEFGLCYNLGSKIYESLMVINPILKQFFHT